MNTRLLQVENLQITQKPFDIVAEFSECSKTGQSSSRGTYSYHESKFKRALIIHPKDWMKDNTFEYSIHSNQILFVKKGLEENRIPTDLLDEEEFDEEKTLRNLDEECLLIFWSLSSLNFRSKFNCLLQSSKIPSSISITKLGVISASPTAKLFARYSEWASIIGKVIFYEEESKYKNELKRFFEVIHLPLIHYSSQPCVIKDVGIQVHFSGTLKYNRLDWLLVLRALCIEFDVDFECKIIKEVRKSGRSKFKYLPEAATSLERRRFSIGINFAQREPGIDAKLIGSFWDYYRNGCIPLVIGENTREMSSYLSQNLDYFSIETEEDLRDVILFFKNNTRHLFLLRERVAARVRDDFNPKKVMETLLEFLSLPRNSR